MKLELTAMGAEKCGLLLREYKLNREVLQFCHTFSYYYVSVKPMGKIYATCSSF